MVAVAAEVAAPQDRAELLREAVALLAASPAGYELARAPAASGTEVGDRGLPARECGADGLEERTSRTLLGLGGALPGGTSRRTGSRRSSREPRVRQPAARG
ncbi:hypothetical protein [Streptomyces subrutilus]|uniref:Uncharacterized protein n=1 Tax=Streptomyces subrutilus TaxID=36818 RepID=A0A1E5PMH1_9ACTN|nr:hypothetical protein [Streptomyces subrutilus]OEJ30725.1 hypothetical protein BGK67_04640 [Streptomyces subrutilus]